VGTDVDRRAPRDENASGEILSFAFADREPHWEITGLITDSRGRNRGATAAILHCSDQRNDGTLALLGAARGESRIAFDPTSSTSAYT
jgi:hypothetical protein